MDGSKLYLSLIQITAGGPTHVCGSTAVRASLTTEHRLCCRCQVIEQRLQWKLDSCDRTVDELDLL